MADDHPQAISVPHASKILSELRRLSSWGPTENSLNVVVASVETESWNRRVKDVDSVAWLNVALEELSEWAHLLTLENRSAPRAVKAWDQEQSEDERDKDLFPPEPFAQARNPDGDEKQGDGHREQHES